MAKRVYFETIKKWLIGTGITIGTLIGGLFLYLSFLGVIKITGHSGDMICAGTLEDPCYAYINLTAKEDIFIYPVGYDPWGRDTIIQFDPAVKDWKLQRSWGNGWRNIPLDKTCTGTWCGAPNNLGVKYSYVLREGRDYQFRIVGYKNNPKETIKWSVNYDDKEYLDPAWYGEVREIGYEFLDNGSVVHIWNTQDDYFFNKSSGIQFTNHFQDYWTRNIFCIGYYSGDTWNKIKCADELNNFNKDIQTDNETYVNATLWKDISYGIYDLRLGINYHLGLDDENLTITIYGKNIGIDIPYDLGFAWKVKDVNIPGIGDDFIDTNHSTYNLSDNFDLTFKNMSQSLYNIHDDTEYLRLNWNENLDYKLNIFSDGNQESFSATLLINAGHFNPGQEKSTILYWIDADTSVNGSVHATSDLTGALWGPYWLNENNGVIVFEDEDLNLSFAKTIDAGITWNTTIIVGDLSVKHIASWFDQETPGDSGTLIHIAWLDDLGGSGNTDGTCYYVTIDINDGSVGTVRTINDTLHVHSIETVDRIAITKTRSGNLIVGFETFTEFGASRSIDNGANWGAIADVYEGGDNNDWLLLFPANTGDDDDAIGLFWDRSANKISVKMYNDTADTWTETEISDVMADDNVHINMDGAVRHSDGHILFGAHYNDDTAGDDLRMWDITPDSISSPTITAKTNIFTDQAESAGASMIINQQNDDVYFAHLKGGTWESTVDVVFHKSTDGMGTWGNEQAYSETTDDIRRVQGGRTIDDDGGRIQWSFFNSDLSEIFVNLVNDIEISAVVGDNFPTVTLSAPPDDTSNSSTSFSFQCNVTDDINIANTTLYIWNSTGVWNNTEINTSTGTSLNYTFPVSNFVIDDYTWNCLAVDNASQSAWAGANFSLNITAMNTCTCPGAGNNWEVDMEDHCNMTEACNLGTGNQSFIGSFGYFNCSANLNLTNRDAPPSGITFYHSSGCEVIRLILLIFISSKILQRKKYGV